MNQSPEQNQSPEERALLKAAADDEQNALNGYLHNRVVILNAEVRRRDQAIQSLEVDLAAALARQCDHEDASGREVGEDAAT